jgi:hypothetical protein
MTSESVIYGVKVERQCTKERKKDESVSLYRTERAWRREAKLGPGPGPPGPRTAALGPYLVSERRYRSLAPGECDSTAFSLPPSAVIAWRPTQIGNQAPHEASSRAVSLMYGNHRLSRTTAMDI